MERKANIVHGEAEKAREGGDFLAALKLLDEAVILYSQEKDIVGMSDAQGSRLLTYRHLFEKTGDESYLILARYAAEGAVGIIQKANIVEGLARPLFNLGKAHEAMQNYVEATDAYLNAIEAFKSHPQKMHNRPAVLFDMEVHAYTCSYFAGNKESLEKACEALRNLENSDESKYNKDVWVSGGYMRLAQALKEDNPEKAKEYLKKAKEIIDANPDLKLRKGQWEKLSSSFK